ncbi:MAG TPA: tripartite tricarboxylate transporter substrate binding protein [Ramlibacter sp.]|uniref:tripartite tricarboxylate transporter substrate binding protein n=1 Tax=Ramlibacter sp. TaxID=1917967 RepID=UPI002C745710|nr:tripartite tricarboxylate transporter substrate binding protein [Ramlibacter sp.]HVZ44761.1 tripartite tricarboxylate transporter substrate binding protein [Ramlibacter sp.]
MKRSSFLAAAMYAAIYAAMCAALSLAFAPPALAQAWPTRPVTLLVPYAPGGGHDTMARLVAERLTAKWGQTVLVENKAGANGMIGAEFVSHAPPDGHTLLFASPAEIVIAPTAYKSMRYDPFNDLAPVTLAGMTPLVVVANPSAGVKTIPELIAKVKANPGKFSFGTAGNASSQHLAGVLLNNMAGIDLVHIPYKGAGPATTDVVGGQTPLAIVGMAPVMGYIKSGKLVALAVTQSRRASFAPDIPTVAETPGLGGFEATHWMGVFAPAKTPADIVKKVQADIHDVVNAPDMKARLLSLGIEPVGSTPAEFKSFLAADRDRFARMFKLTGLSPE